MSHAWRIAAQFDLNGVITEVVPHGRGLINDTYRVVTDEAPAAAILQRINRHVFARPDLIMANLRALVDHAERGQARAATGFRLPALVRTLAGEDFHRDEAGDCWRALGFIDETTCSDTIGDLGQAEQVGFALGRFHALVSALDCRFLHDTLPGFHIAPAYLAYFDAVRAQLGTLPDAPATRFCLAFIESRRDRVGVLEDAKARGLLAPRPIHGDPKLNNFLFDRHDGRAVSLVDLDTFKPGLIHYDIGDCLRSCCNRAGEQTGDGAAVEFDLAVCRALLTRYVEEARSFLTVHDYAFLFEAIRLIPFELGLRFFTDHLEGNRYFKVTAPEQNLQRAVTQFQLTASIEREESAIRRLIDELAAA